MKLHILLMLRALPQWLALSRAERSKLAAAILPTAFANDATFRYFDCEAFNAQCSDFLLVEAKDTWSWNCVMERLRDSALFAHPYFEVTGIYPAFEDGFREFEAQSATDAA